MDPKKRIQLNHAAISEVDHEVFFFLIVLLTVEKFITTPDSFHRLAFMNQSLINYITFSKDRQLLKESSKLEFPHFSVHDNH